MAEKNPNQIDINLSLLSGQDGAHFAQFVKELSTISKTLMRVSKMSFPQVGDQTALNVEGGGPSRGAGALQQREAEKNKKSTDRKPGEGSSSGEATASATVERSRLRERLGSVNHLVRKALGDYNHAYPIDDSEINDYQKISGFEDEGRQGPPRRPRGGPSRGGGGGGDEPPEDVLRLNDWADKQLILPRFGDLTFQDKIGAMRDVFARLSLSEDGKSIGNERYADWAQKLDQGYRYAPALRMAREGAQFLNSQTLARTQAAQTYGTSLGYQRDSRFDVNLGPFGFQAPGSQLLTTAGQKNISDWFDRVRYAMQPGISRDQVDEIFSNLQGRGYVSGQVQQDMLQNMVDIVKKNPGMDINQVGSLQDEAARFGAESLDAFNKSLNDVPDIAHKANISVNEFMAHMQEMGTLFNTQLGGTAPQGYQYAQDFTLSTGLPSPIGGQLLENPFVQSRIMSQTGLLPQQMGNAGGPTLLQGSLDAVKQLYGMYAGMHGRTWTDKRGATWHVSGQRQRESMVAAQLGIPVDRVHQLITHSNEMSANEEVRGITNERQAAIDRISSDPRLSSAEKSRQLEALTHSHNYDVMMRTLTKKNGFSADEINRIKGGMLDKDHGFGGLVASLNDPEHALRNQDKVIRSILKDHERKLTDDRTSKNGLAGMIGLNEDAKKFFKLIDNQNNPAWVNKVLAQAGNAALNSNANQSHSLTPSNPTTDSMGG